MNRFYTKYMKQIPDNLHLKMMQKELKKALKDFNRGKDYLYHLSVLSEMLEDVFEVNNTNPSFHKNDKDATE